MRVATFTLSISDPAARRLTVMRPADHAAAIGQTAPLFVLPAIDGGTVALDSYRGRRHVIVWFSRGFTCAFCRNYIDRILDGYGTLLASETELIQVAPNLVEGAREFFAPAPLPYPFVCDPDKRLYAVYGLGSLGALEATRAAVVSFSHAFATGGSGAQMRGAWLDVVNRNFIRRLHHHATSALEQGLFLVDKEGIVRHRIIVGPLDPIPSAAVLAGLVTTYCGNDSHPA
jgi:peroxiredoxin